MTYCRKANQTSYPFILPDLPYAKESFKPHFTCETFDYHHGKHHNSYVQNLNNLLKDREELQKKDLEGIIKWSSKNSEVTVFNNASQIWNHTFFWYSIKPHGGGKPSGKVFEQISQDFGSFEQFCEQFKQEALGQFGSGWVWVVYNNNKLQIIKTSNADTPIVNLMKPILVCDVWEHAYYIDYRNKRSDYIDIFISHMINWKFVEDNLIQ
ncbi:superoxide dismutase [Rickettsia typhi]|uniref:Superoxide dismutase [Mn/Fe] n=2 Tax=Rickettsia typhi TaxID=785 RepID=SODF_RICTY|nr:superoxide dismutase [Rickettsia typhi]Q68WK0.1 RecName: Full=Superoxide dismutase [Mn/Fe] [Rickettsia typhi str. Wilmington]AAU03992.1 superoxide dismutase [Rickettsia typhi str. Wilmington]AFE54372.1 superoxide dismutase [Rickettsia typhi str. TH1527]AFE55210.1 superoxide dismutase [Rickettsia typhi str. B9991CWPP]